MFEITIKGETLTILAGNLQHMAEQFSRTPSGSAIERALTKTRKAMVSAPNPEPAPDPKVEPELPFIKEYTAADEEDTPPEPMPVGATAVVDAGTGQPVSQIITAEFVDVEPVKQMTMTDVKVAAAKLAAKDTPKLASILKKYNAAKLSEVAPDALGDFAGEVMDALG